MDGLILANKNGIEIRELNFDTYDFEVGEINNWMVTARRQDFEDVPTGARVYIPGTEYGGLFRQLKTSTLLDTISFGGLTWRGMLQAKIIEPPAGYDYATDSGELNAIVKARVEAAFPDSMIIGSTESTGVAIPTYQYNRYCTLEAGLNALLGTVGYKLDLSYSQTSRALIVSAVPVVDYSNNVDFSSDLQMDYTMEMQGDGVNHLICLGKGELKNRTVYNLYVDADGNIGTTQVYTGADEIVAIYDSGGSELDDLIASGKNRLEQLKNKNEFEIIVSDIDVAVGDIVGGRDYLSGMSLKSPVTGKILKWEDGFRTIDYKLGEGTADYIVTWVCITKQPTDVAGVLNAYVYATLTAENAVSYQWEYYNPGTGLWKNTTYQGATTDTLRIRVNATTVTYGFRCIVTGSDGTTITSNAISVSIIS